MEAESSCKANGSDALRDLQRTAGKQEIKRENVALQKRNQIFLCSFTYSVI